MQLAQAKPFLEILKERIEGAIPNSNVQILDPRNDGVHLEAHVTSLAFKEKLLVEQHRMVYAAVQDLLDSGELHALAIKTKVE